MHNASETDQARVNGYYSIANNKHQKITMPFSLSTIT